MAPQSQQLPPPLSLPAASDSAAPTAGETPTQSSGPPAQSTTPPPPPPPTTTTSSNPPPSTSPPPPTSTPSSSSPPPQTSSDTPSNSGQPSPSQSPASQSTGSTTPDASSQTSSISNPSSSSGPPPSGSPAPSLTSSDTSTPTPQVSSSPSLSTSIFVYTSGGHTSTVTSIVPVSGVPSPTDLNAQGRTSSKGFFDNKGAVAGVFAVVGVIGAIILVLLLTNAIRRRQAKQFDREVAEAAREAATVGHARGPDIDDDDDFGYNLNHSVYTGDSHGTYSQQPLQPVGMESYNMNELHQPNFDPYASSGISANAAGIGAAGLNRSKSSASPYNAFATPAGSVEGQSHSPPPIPMPTTSDPFYDPGSSLPMLPPSNNYPGMHMGMYGQPQAPSQPVNDRQASLLEAAGFASGAAVVSGAAVRRAQSRSTNNTLSRNRSVGGMSGSDHTHEMYTTSAHYDSVSGHGHGQGPATYPQVQPYMQVAPATARPYPEPYHPQQQARPVSMAVSTVSGEDPYAAYEEQPGSPIRDDFHTSVHGHQPAHNDNDGDDEEYPVYSAGNRDSRTSIRDENDYGYGGGRRVLKVANE